MKYDKYPYPCYVRRNEYDSLELIPVYQGCDAEKFGCACLGMCLNIIDYLSAKEVDSHDIAIVN